MNWMSVTMHGMGYSIGVPVSINEVSRSDEERDLVSFFADDGFCTFIRSAEDIGEMVVHAVSDAFTKTPLGRQEIDGIILCTESFWDKDLSVTQIQPIPDHYKLREGLLQAVFDRCGLINAHPYGNWLSACANFVTTVNIAQALIASGQHNNIAVVMVDRLAPQASRIMRSRASILSDMASCFLVGRLRCGYAIRHVVMHVATSVYLAQDDKDVQRRVLTTIGELKVFARKIQSITGRKIGDYDRITVDCLNSSWIELISQSLGVDRKRLSSSRKATYAHAFAMDSLLALSELNQSGALRSGEEVALLNLGPWAYGLVVLEVL
jgi:3-oxoacyl-[acyl-carrier-protein] synthase III